MTRGSSRSCHCRRCTGTVGTVTPRKINPRSPSWQTERAAMGLAAKMAAPRGLNPSGAPMPSPVRLRPVRTRQAAHCARVPHLPAQPRAPRPPPAPGEPASRNLLGGSVRGWGASPCCGAMVRRVRGTLEVACDACLVVVLVAE